MREPDGTLPAGTAEVVLGAVAALGREVWFDPPQAETAVAQTAATAIAKAILSIAAPRSRQLAH